MRIVASLALTVFGLASFSHAAEKEEPQQFRIVVGDGGGVTFSTIAEGAVVQEGGKQRGPAQPQVRLSNDLRELVEASHRLGEAANSAFLGISTSEAPAVLRHQLKLKPEGAGLVVDSVVPGSPAAKAGIQPYDVLQKVDDQIVFNAAQLTALVHSMKAGDQVKLRVIREGEVQTLAATLGKNSEGGERIIRLEEGNTGKRPGANPWVQFKGPAQAQEQPKLPGAPLEPKKEGWSQELRVKPAPGTVVEPKKKTGDDESSGSQRQRKQKKHDDDDQ